MFAKKLSLIAAASLLAGQIAVADQKAGHKPPAGGGGPAAIAPNANDVIVKVDGMTCTSCMNKVKKGLAALDAKYKGKGVKFEVLITEVKAQIDLKSAQLTDAEKAELKEKIAEVVKTAGYTPVI
jgi:copper chaperone CopZ